ncbi:MAG: SDR family NAD(P)-dependent oxidoreductase [Coriobacteriales bacterium]|jgi:NAD(P)-dependent dehydrogenase (short-subunit alcohol dehydrogenase family)
MANENPFEGTPEIDLSNTCLEKGCLDGEVAVVTGSTSNVGMGFARALAWAGAKVVVCGRNETRGNAVKDIINKESGEGSAIFVRCDVTKEEDVKNLSKKAFEAFGKVDILINNAMNLALNGTVLDSPIEDLDMSYAISARGSMLTIKEFVPGMIERHHGYVTYSSTQFNFLPPMLGGSMYTAGKSAATSLTMSLANEVKDKGVKVFCFCPAGVGQINPESVESMDDVDEMQLSMPGFPGLIPADASGAAMVYSLLHADEIHGSGVIVSEALIAMGYPFPVPETAKPSDSPRIEDPFAITMMFCNMGKNYKALSKE